MRTIDLLKKMMALGVSMDTGTRGTYVATVGTPKQFIVKEGDYLKAKGSTTVVGTITRIDSFGATVQTWNLVANGAVTAGPFTGRQILVVTCSIGSVEVVVGSAVLGAAQVVVDAVGVTSGINTLGGRIPLRPNQLVGSMSGGSSPLPATTDSMITSAGTTRCYHFALGVSGGPFSAFKFVYANHSTTVAGQIDGAIGGTSSTAYPGGTFNIALPESGWTANAGASAIGLAFSAKCPAITVGPVMVKPSITRAAGELDGGKTELIFGRVVQLAANVAFPFSTLGAGFPAYWDVVNEGISVLVGSPYFGDAVASPGSFLTSTRADSPACPIIGVIPLYDRIVTTFGEVFDSIGAGLGAAGDRMKATPSFLAVSRIRTAGKSVAYQQSSISGATMPDIVQHVKDLSLAGFFNILIISPYTVNSPIATQADWDLQWYQMMTAVRYHLSLNPQNAVIIKTPLPMNSFTVAQNGYRLKCLARVRATGFPYVDLESLADSLGHWADPADTTDGTHMTPQGRNKTALLSEPVYSNLAP